jgi:hypothetical protein
MASEAQIAANRLNARKSTGPRTPQGKAVMRRNPLRHGLSAASVVLFYESEAEFERFRQDLAQDFEPQGAEECALVEQIAILRWRLRRASRAEAALVNAEAEHRRACLAGGASKTLYPIDAGMIFDGRIQSLATLTRYEASLERQLSRACAMLERRQARRLERWRHQEAEPADPPEELSAAAPAVASGPIPQESRHWVSRPDLSNEISDRDSDSGPGDGNGRPSTLWLRERAQPGRREGCQEQTIKPVNVVSGP